MQQLKKPSQVIITHDSTPNFDPPPPTEMSPENNLSVCTRLVCNVTLLFFVFVTGGAGGGERVGEVAGFTIITFSPVSQYFRLPLLIYGKRRTY